MANKKTAKKKATKQPPNGVRQSALVEQRIAMTAESSLVVPHGIQAQTADPSCIGSNLPDPAAFCVALTVGGIPIGARIDNVRLFAREKDADKWSECKPKVDAPLGWCKFPGNYQIQTNNLGISIRQEFRNWSHDRDREARLLVEYSFIRLTYSIDQLAARVSSLGRR